jgi:nucleotide-binding universal stress UspA family protein
LIVARRPIQQGALEHEIVSEALFDVHRPTLLIPPKTVHIERGGAVAWNGSLEAATALERASDVLDRDALVTVIQVGDLRHGALPMEEAIAYLESRGFKTRPRLLPDQPHSTAEIILREARAFGAGILVAGAYTHSRIRETLLGGVTAALIGKAHMPVFLAR